MSAHEKALRILDEGRLERDVLPARVFHVTGEHGSYTVVIAQSVRSCSCPHGQLVTAGRQIGSECSHILAAIQWCIASEEQRTGYEQALERRRATVLA